LRRAIAEAACRGAYCLYLALNDTHLARWHCNCLVQFGDRKTADELVARARHGRDRHAR
jgi:hypothetical protein